MLKLLSRQFQHAPRLSNDPTRDQHKLSSHVAHQDKKEKKEKKLKKDRDGPLPAHRFVLSYQCVRKVRRGRCESEERRVEAKRRRRRSPALSSQPWADCSCESHFYKDWNIRDDILVLSCCAGLTYRKDKEKRKEKKKEKKAQLHHDLVRAIVMSAFAWWGLNTTNWCSNAPVKC